MTDTSHDIEEDIRREQMGDAVKKYAPMLIVGVVVVLLGIGGWQVFTTLRAQQAANNADRFAAAEKLLEAKDFAGAEKAFAEVSKSGGASYRAAAQMGRAAALVGEADLKGALAAMDAAGEAANDSTLRDLAKMKAAYLAADQMDLAALRPRLDDLIKGGGAFSFQARELLGMKAMDAGQTDTAREQFDFLVLALDAPEGVRQRAQTSLAMLGPPPAKEKAAGATPAEPAEAPAASPAPKKGQ